MGTDSEDERISDTYCQSGFDCFSRGITGGHDLALVNSDPSTFVVLELSGEFFINHWRLLLSGHLDEPFERWSSFFDGS